MGEIIVFYVFFLCSAYWKFAITGADNNTEIKVWDCGTWNCLQTIEFCCSVDKPLRFIAELDRTSSYLVVSSLETRTCYVMQIINTSTCYSSIKGAASDNEDSVNKDSSDNNVVPNITHNSPPILVYVKSISEFPLSSGILSFSIVDAAVRRYKCSNDNYLCEELDDYDEETSSIYCVAIHLYVIQAKSMQECHILYQPSVPENIDVKSTISSSDISGVSRNNISNKTVPSNASENDEQADDNDDDVSDDVDNEKEADGRISSASINKDEVSPNEQNTLELFLGLSSATSVTSANIVSSTGGSNVVAVAAAAAAAPSALATENKVESRNTSPKVAAGNKSYSQLNLMTPDAFSSTSATNGKYYFKRLHPTHYLTDITFLERKTPENVSSEVLNTILMLAGVTGQNVTPGKTENINLLNLVNNKMIEESEIKHQDIESQKNFIGKSFKI